MPATSSPISQVEDEVLRLLYSTTCILNSPGRIRWALDADDVCGLLELGAELAGGALDPAESNRVARLLAEP
jgi:hypothetical protein